MNTRKSRTRRVGALAATATAVVAALTSLPAAALPDPGQVAFEGAYATDGFINAAEAALADPGGRPVSWTAPDGAQTGAEGRFTDAADAIPAGGNCGPFTLAANGDGTNGYLNLSCMAALPEGEVRWQIRWTPDGGATFGDWSSASIVVDRIAPTTAITAPAEGATTGPTPTVSGTTEPGSAVTVFSGAMPLGSATASPTGAWSLQVSLSAGAQEITASAIDPAGNQGAATDPRAFTVDASAPGVSISSPVAGSLQKGDFTVAGLAEPGSTVQVLIDSAPVGQATTTDVDGKWSVKLFLIPTGTHNLQAQATDGVGNIATTPALSIDVDGHEPTAEITEPINYAVFAPGEDIIIEGTAHDTNGQAFAGVWAVEVNIHNPLRPNFRPDAAPYIVQVGTVVSQANSDCSLCPTSGGGEVEWSYDASWLPTGTYTFQLRTFDKAGNTADQPQSLVIVRL